MLTNNGHISIETTEQLNKSHFKYNFNNTYSILGSKWLNLIQNQVLAS